MISQKAIFAGVYLRFFSEALIKISSAKLSTEPEASDHRVFTTCWARVPFLVRTHFGLVVITTPLALVRGKQGGVEGPIGQVKSV